MALLGQHQRLQNRLLPRQPQLVLRPLGLGLHKDGRVRPMLRPRPQPLLLGADGRKGSGNQREIWPFRMISVSVVIIVHSLTVAAVADAADAADGGCSAVAAAVAAAVLVAAGSAVAADS